jgi:transcriptional regulator with XRE-family HTH domain
MGVMRRSKRSAQQMRSSVEATRIASTLGQVVRRIREDRRWTQQRLGDEVGLSPVRIGELERGDGATAPLATWVLIGLVLDRPLAVTFSAPLEGSSRLADAGHLDMQEALLAMTRRNGWFASFELPTRSSDPRHSVDVLVRDDIARRLLTLECWNRFGDLGAAARSTDRKVAEAAALAIAAGGAAAPYSLHACWVVRPSAANRELVRRYPGIFRARFAGSSQAWSRALNDGSAPPTAPGLVWLDPATRRAVPVRLRR